MRVKTDEKVVNNSSDEKLIQALRSIWLGELIKVKLIE